MKDIFYQIAPTNITLSDLSVDSAVYFIKEIQPKLNNFLNYKSDIYGTQKGWVEEKITNSLGIMFRFDLENTNETTFFNISGRGFDQFTVNWFLLLVDFYIYFTTLDNQDPKLLNIINLYLEKSLAYLRKNYSIITIKKEFNQSLEGEMPFINCKFKDLLFSETLNYIQIT
jgi:hypothetical protein